MAVHRDQLSNEIGVAFLPLIMGTTCLR